MNFTPEQIMWMVGGTLAFYWLVIWGIGRWCDARALAMMEDLDCLPVGNIPVEEQHLLWQVRIAKEDVTAMCLHPSMEQACMMGIARREIVYCGGVLVDEKWLVVDTFTECTWILLSYYRVRIGFIAHNPYYNLGFDYGD